jgi:hypothetical protein
MVIFEVLRFRSTGSYMFSVCYLSFWHLIFLHSMAVMSRNAANACSHVLFTWSSGRRLALLFCTLFWPCIYPVLYKLKLIFWDVMMWGLEDTPFDPLVLPDSIASHPRSNLSIYHCEKLKFHMYESNVYFKHCIILLILLAMGWTVKIRFWMEGARIFLLLLIIIIIIYFHPRDQHTLIQERSMSYIKRLQ